jgi:DNA repair exonuclease SbcCD nuclease subunit
MKNPIAILAADIHLRDDQPKCRIDNYWDAQEEKIDFILALTEKNNCALLIAGDLFHKAKSSPYLERWALNKFYNCSIVVIPGQHDLPNHSIDQFENSSFGVVSTMCDDSFPRNPFEKIYRVDWNGLYEKDIKMGMVHTFIPKPDDKQDTIISSNSALSFLKKNKEYDLILSGDNHKTFVVEHQGRLLVNPGSMMRYNASQTEHKPCVFIWYDDNTVEQVFLPISKNVIDREYLEKENKKNERIESFVNRIKTDYEIDLSFQKNLEVHFTHNKTRKGIIEKVWEVVE